MTHLMVVSDLGFSTPQSGSTITGVFPDSLQREFPLNSKFKLSSSLFLSTTSLFVVKPTKEFLMISIVGTKTTSGSRTIPTTSKVTTSECTGMTNFHCDSYTYKIVFFIINRLMGNTRKTIVGIPCSNVNVTIFTPGAVGENVKTTSVEVPPST